MFDFLAVIATSEWDGFYFLSASPHLKIVVMVERPMPILAHASTNM
jgi:hypothetical protein